MASSCVKERPSDVNQDSIWTHYQFNYDENEQSTIIKVVTRFNEAFGTKIQLSEGASLQFNGEELEWSQFEGAYYKEIDNFIDEGVFTYTDLDGRVFENHVELEIADFPEQLDSISRFETYMLEWVGGAITEEDNIILTVNSLENSTSLQFFENAPTATQIVMNIDLLQLFPNGHSEWMMQRRGVLSDIETPAAGGVVEWTYVTADRVVYLE